MVLNLSQQTDSGDLLGGFRPVQPAEAVLPLLEQFNDLVRVLPCAVGGASAGRGRAPALLLLPADGSCSSRRGHALWPQLLPSALGV